MRSRTLGILLAVSGVIMMIMGAGRGELALVLSKAIRICLECIGIG